MKTSILFIATLFIFQFGFSQNLVFKDPNFLKAILELETKIDVNDDGIIQQIEADQVKELRLMSKNIQFLDDAYHFKNLEELVLTNNEIKEVKLHGFQYLKNFYCTMNLVTRAEIKDLPLLESIALNSNKELTSLQLENLPLLNAFSAERGQLTEFDPSKFPLMKYLSLSENKISTLDITKNPELIQLTISENPIKELDIRSNPKFQTHILYADPTLVLITTPAQEAQIKKLGLGKTIRVH